MFVRIVKMSFQPEKVDEFLTNFEKVKNRIRAFEGCELLELYRDKEKPHIFFTYSYWQDEYFLERYRNSDLFKKVWSKTKVLFNEKAKAWSVDKISILN